MATLIVACSLLLLNAAQGQYHTTPSPAGTSNTPCGGYLSGSRGGFNSPDYPNYYPNNAECVWYIQAHGGNQVIKLDFPLVSLEGDSNCHYDAISVYDGSSTGGRLLGKLCGRQSSSFHSTGAYMTVRFRSDSSSNYPGFRAEYQLVAEGSCRYNCGQQVGNCSCSHLCEYNGNCCQDYRNHCSGVTPGPQTQTTPEMETTMRPTYPHTWSDTTAVRTTTDRDLCRYNCGYDVGNCSCHYNCQYYGNCCPSYYEYCAGTTAGGTTAGVTTAGGTTAGVTTAGVTTAGVTTAGVTTAAVTQVVTDYTTYPARPSCRYNCGSNLGSCSCSSSCQYYGNCCYDYSSYCAMTTPQSAGTTAAQRSCRYNCGSNLGSCSCSSSCQYYGNCCYDYSSYCAMTTAQSAGTTAAQRSCRYNCGSNLGSCSCSSSCQRYGNCCYDYSNYCASTTPDAATTARPSCRYNCGSNHGSCSCSSSCQYYGNCCYDYSSYCAMTTAQSAGTTAAHRSCRYNCGSNLGSCSCSSSCQRYGNCCYDYSNYCASTTPDAATTARPSCRYNCGSNHGSCSCSSSCQYYGNCCYDYSSYCAMTTNSPYTTAPPTAGPCGENLYGSGAFTSPYHPGYYHDNANCVWQLSVPAGQRVYLSFTSLELQNCCNCDYVAVYDGPSVHSRPLGKLCSGGNATQDAFHSSSSYLTVVFRSDRSVVGRGFEAQFRSSLPASTGRVDCSSDIMNIVVDRSYLNSMGYDGYNLYLNDQHCRPSVSSYQVVFSFPINTCGTVRKFVNERVVYTNALRASPSNSGEISRQSQFTLNVQCHMEKDTMVQIMYQANEVSNSTITGSGRFNGTMAFYHSSSFYNQVTEVPFKVKLNQDLYVQVSLRRSDSNLVLFLDTCVASPSPHDFQTRSYDLVRNGCQRDNTYRPYRSGSHSNARFTFKAFRFLRTHEFVYLQCKVIICQASDYNSRCRRGCSSRKARALGSNHDSHTLVLGPIQRQDLEKEGELPQPEVKDEVKA